MFLINQKGEAKIAQRRNHQTPKAKEEDDRERVDGKDDAQREGRRDKVGRHVAASARRGSPIVLRNRLCLITSNWLAVDNATG